ncbi:MAG: cytochrome P450 [Dermatophilus congolensis]|nr:cytochrome P450 [Dermatophilus congolensis]
MTSTLGCPVDHGARKTFRENEAAAPGISVEQGVWHIRSLPLVGQVLRDGRNTVQAGFNAEYVRRDGIGKPPILYLDGEAHRDQRSKIARYFAPKVVGSKYREFMEKRAAELIDRMLEYGEVELSDVAMRYSVEVAAQVIGLGDADMQGMASRLEKFFATPSIAPSSADGPKASRFDSIGMAMRGAASVSAFYLRDVRPAIRARRKNPTEDVISHLIAEGYDDPSILTECITYGAAGMVTTREFISMVTWHMVEKPELRAKFLAADEADRRVMLLEILRLEPIVGHLYRHTTAPITLVDGDQTYEVPEGALLDLYVRMANADPDHVGPDPLQICPGRDLPSRVRDEVMSFGDGGHRCPGNHIALQEADIFLRLLFRHQVELVSEPTIQWDELIAGYEVRNIRLRVTA